MEHNDILILPDIHGRHFWKTAVSNPENYGKIIFLGDYLDPYPREEITLHDAFENFRSIVAFKEEHPDQVILLLGNHDLHYVDKVYCDLAMSTRYDYDHAARNADFFHAHLPLFQLAFQTQNGDRSFLFTHAGVTQLWYYQHESEIGSLTADHLNSLLLNNIRILADIGYYRGGYADSGSMVWADIDEMLNSAPIAGFYQIFGHTQQDTDDPIITSTMACLDCRRPFVLHDGTLSPLQSSSSS